MAMSITAIATTSAPRGTARSAAQASAASAVTEPSVATRIRLMATWLLPFVSPQTGPESQPPSPPHQGHCPLGGGPIGTNAGLTGRGSARRRLSPALVTGSPSQQQLSDLLDREDGADECSEHKPPPRVESRGAEQPLKGRGVDQGGSKSSSKSTPNSRNRLDSNPRANAEVRSVRQANALPTWRMTIARKTTVVAPAETVALAVLRCPQVTSPARMARTLPAQRSRAKRWTNWPPSRRTRPGPRVSAIALEPNRAARSRTSSDVRPSGREPSAAKMSSRGSSIRRAKPSVFMCRASRSSRLEQRAEANRIGARARSAAAAQASALAGAPTVARTIVVGPDGMDGAPSSAEPEA